MMMILQVIYINLSIIALAIGVTLGVIALENETEPSLVLIKFRKKFGSTLSIILFPILIHSIISMFVIYYIFDLLDKFFEFIEELTK